MKFHYFLLTLLFFKITCGTFEQNWNKWDYIGYPNRFASQTVTMYMGDSPAANFEMGPFGRGPFVMYW